MRFTRLQCSAFTCGCTAALLLLLSSCQGRKASNMEPTGETIECVIESAQTEDVTENSKTVDSTSLSRE